MKDIMKWVRQAGSAGMMLALVMSLGVVQPQQAFCAGGLDPAVADFNDDGVVNIGDFALLGGRFTQQAGTEGYVEGLDIHPDGVIDIQDINLLIPLFNTTGIATDPTVFHGLVMDGIGNPLPGVMVEVTKNGNMVASGQTDQTGEYRFNIPVGGTGFDEVTFNGSMATDPTDDGILSGQYPTLPNKPVFINGGVNDVNQFRDISLPERDLTGGVDLRLSSAVMDIGNDAFRVKAGEELVVNNVGVKLTFSENCELTPAPGEDPVISITKIDPTMLPIQMPPGLSSSLFGTFQPGGTTITNGGGCSITVEYDNVDGFNVGDTPIFNGVTNGVFSQLGPNCTVVDVGNDSIANDVFDKVQCGPIPLPFTFAWYHTDIIPVPPDPAKGLPCERTQITGRVGVFTLASPFSFDPFNIGSNIIFNPAFNATVSIPGATPVTTNGDGEFIIPNVPAGPNGPRCFTHSFNVQVTAIGHVDGMLRIGRSFLRPALPGQPTAIGTILLLNDVGTVTGTVKKLSRLSPLLIDPLPGTNLDLFSGPGFNSSASTTTDNTGTYRLNLAQGDQFELDASFDGQVTLPSGGTATKQFSGHAHGQIDFDQEFETVDFLFTSTGIVKVTVANGTACGSDGCEVTIDGDGGTFGGRFVIDPFHRSSAFFFVGSTFEVGSILPVAGVASSSGLVAPGEMVTFGGNTSFLDPPGIPLGSCQVTVNSGPPNSTPLGSPVPCFVNEHGQFLDITAPAP